MDPPRFQTLDGPGLAAALAGERAPFVLDVRLPEAFAAGHIPGSRNVPVHEMARRPRDLPASKVARVIVIAEPGKRGEAAASFLVLMGWADVALLDGGMYAWKGPVEKG